MSLTQATSHTQSFPFRGSRAFWGHFQSRMAGHVYAGLDGMTALEGARLYLDGLEVVTGAGGLFETPLDGLPVELEVVIVAPGYHPRREYLNWAQVASGGLIMRDYHLTPAELPAPTPSSGQRAELLADLEICDDDELVFEDEQGVCLIDDPDIQDEDTSLDLNADEEWIYDGEDAWDDGEFDLTEELGQEIQQWNTR